MICKTLDVYILSDGPSISKARERRRAAKTPRKSKRMAARLDGHGSGEVENSKSVSERLVCLINDQQIFGNTTKQDDR